MMRRGVALIEMVAVIAIVGVVMLIAGPLTRTVLRTTSHAQRAIGEVAGVDRIAARLRSDTWNAIEMVAPNARTLVLRWVGGKSVVWQIARDGKSIRRTHWAGEQQVEQHTWPCPSGLSFEAGMHTAKLLRAGDASESAGAMTFVSQVLLGSGATP